MKILLTGATGFIGRALCQRLLDQGHVVYAWVRDLARARSILDSRVKCFLDLEEIYQEDIEAIINLAGEPIADQRWTDERKQVLLDSRVGVTNALYEFCVKHHKTPSVVLSGSAIGYYGYQVSGNKEKQVPLRESSEPVAGFGHTLCDEWEKAALHFASEQTRVCLMRTGIVLGKGGGALKKMLLPFRLGLGASIGDGQQVMSWIHMDDWINACLFLLSRDELSGPFNFVSPNPVNNQTFTQVLARSVHRPALFRVPCLPLKLALGEVSELLCKGQRVIPEKLMFAGFKFEFGDINLAMADVVEF